MMAQLRSEITVTVKDRDAQQALDEIVRKLEHAQKISRDLGFGGGGGGGVGGGGARASGAPAGNTTSTARGVDGGDGRDLRVRGNLGLRGIQAAGSAGMYAATTVAGGAQNPAFSIQLFGRAITGMTDAVGASVTKMINEAGESFQSIPGLGVIPQLAATIGISAAAATTLMSQAVTSRYEQVMNLANLERPMAQLRTTGGIGGGIGASFIGDAAALGFRPQEAAQMMAGFSRSIGARGGAAAAYGAGINPFEASLSGLSPEMMARYLSTGGLGGGGMTGAGGIGGAAGALQGALGVVMGENFNFRGAKVDEALARISSATTQMAEQGLNLDLGSLNQSMADLAATGAARAGGGRNEFGGMNALRTSVRLSQAGPRAAQQFGAPFGGLITAAIQAYAFENAESPLEAMQIMQEVGADPGRTRQIVVDKLGPETAATAFAGGGIASARGSAILAGKQIRGDVSPGGMGGAGAGDVPLSSMLAEQEARLMGKVGADAVTNAAMLTSMLKIQDLMIDLSGEAAFYLQSVDSMLRTITGR